jgi:hypothetical protein
MTGSRQHQRRGISPATDKINPCRYKDQAGNISGPYTSTITVDSAPPVSAIISPVAGATINGVNYTITGTADDGTGSGISLVEVSVDDGTSWTSAAGTTPGIIYGQPR